MERIDCMKIKILSFALALLLLLSATGCAAKKPITEDIAALYSAATQISAKAEINVFSQGILGEYTVEYTKSGDSSKVTILAPESLSGISATVKGGGAQITYDGVSVETLLPYIPGFSPVDGLDGIFGDLANSVPQDWGQEKYDGTDCYTLTYTAAYDDYSLEKRIWLDKEALVLGRCELYIDGTMSMTVEVESISIY